MRQIQFVAERWANNGTELPVVYSFIFDAHF